MEPRSMNPAFAIRVSTRDHFSQTAWKSFACESYEETSHWTKVTVSPVGSSSLAMASPCSTRRPEMTTR